MGLCLLPIDDDGDGPDASWSYGRFGNFRMRLAAAEGFLLREMHGFGGDRPWSSVQTTLEPLLNHPDDHGVLSPADCAAVLPRLVEIINGWAADDPDRALTDQISTGRDLVTVMHVCIKRGSALLFA